MSEQEFQAYMSGSITSVSAWESALVACESMHQLCEHISTLKSLSERTTTVRNNTTQLKEDIISLKEEITKSVDEVLERTPLVIKPRQFPLNLEVELEKPKDLAGQSSEQGHYLQNLQMQSVDLLGDSKSKMKLELTPCVKIESEDEVAKISASPTPDDAQNDSISKINYDIDFSDVSADNSVADELTPELNKSSSFTPDPFSPLGSSCTVTQAPLMPSAATVDTTPKRPPPRQPADDFVLPFLEETTTETAANETIIDKQESLIDVLPTPLKPTTSEYSGFSKQGWQIPNIPCNTGDYSSLNAMLDQPSCSSSQTVKEEKSKDDQSDDKVVKVLSGVLDTFDKLF